MMTSSSFHFNRTATLAIGVIILLLVLHTVIILHPSNNYHNRADLLALKCPTTTHPLPSSTELSPAPVQTQISTADKAAQWNFTAARDERAYGLTAEQCDAAFPGLFTEIDRAVEYRKKIGNITIKDVDISWKDDGAVRAVIIDQQVRLIPHVFSLPLAY